MQWDVFFFFLYKCDKQLKSFTRRGFHSTALVEERSIITTRKHKYNTSTPTVFTSAAFEPDARRHEILRKNEHAALVYARWQIRSHYQHNIGTLYGSIMPYHCQARRVCDMPHGPYWTRLTIVLRRTNSHVERPTESYTHGRPPAGILLIVSSARRVVKSIRSVAFPTKRVESGISSRRFLRRKPKTITSFSYVATPPRVRRYRTTVHYDGRYATHAILRERPRFDVRTTADTWSYTACRRRAILPIGLFRLQPTETGSTYHFVNICRRDVVFSI